MKPWTETQIGLIFFGGLLAALITGVLAILYLRPFNNQINRITGGITKIWSHSFITTLMIAGLLGALSVSFRDCHGDYDYLLKSKKETVMKGLQQVSSSLDYLSWTIGFWLILFLVIFIVIRRKLKVSEKESGR
jgi:hypothetical protein